MKLTEVETIHEYKRSRREDIFYICDGFKTQKRKI